MKKIGREDIHIISRHSNWAEKSIEKTLKEHVYSDKVSWKKFLKIFFISLGVSFTTAGVLFFFAYNWADLDKFIKIGLIEGLIIITTLFVLFSNTSLDIKNILLSGASILVGVLFAVFGQIYQTGANAYDFFFGWTLSIFLWALVSNFTPLWLIFIGLINTTIVLYSEQVAHDWSPVFIFTLLFGVNLFFLIIFLYGEKLIGNIMKPPVWFTYTIALAVISCCTFGIAIGIFDNKQIAFFTLIILTSLSYVVGIKYGLTTKSGFYLSIIPFSIIIIISAFLIKISNDAGMFFIISFFIIGSVTLVIKNLLNLQKKWKE